MAGEWNEWKMLFSHTAESLKCGVKVRYLKLDYLNVNPPKIWSMRCSSHMAMVWLGVAYSHVNSNNSINHYLFCHTPLHPTLPTPTSGKCKWPTEPFTVRKKFTILSSQSTGCLTTSIRKRFNALFLASMNSLLAANEETTGFSLLYILTFSWIREINSTHIVKVFP